jgi:hypothetical protein
MTDILQIEYKVDGVSDEWIPSGNTSPRWREVIEPALDLLTVTEVAFTVGDPDRNVVIRYRKAQS